MAEDSIPDLRAINWIKIQDEGQSLKCSAEFPFSFLEVPSQFPTGIASRETVKSEA